VGDSDRRSLILLCERALAGEIGLGELSQAWPLPVENGALVPLREVLEDGIVHTPVDRSRAGVDLEALEQMPEFSDIEPYLRLLKEPHV
jgi:hypothetical protein